MTPIDLTAFWAMIATFYEGGGWPFQALVIIVVAVLIRYRGSQTLTSTSTVTAPPAQSPVVSW